jgi:hypothetical protein
MTATCGRTTEVYTYRTRLDQNVVISGAFRYQAFTPARRVVAQEDGGDGFLLHLDTGQYYSLNRTGMLVWQALANGTDPIEALRARFPDSPREQLDRDISTVLTQLADAHLIDVRSAGQA